MRNEICSIIIDGFAKLRKEVEKDEDLYAPQFRAAKTQDDYWALKGEYDSVAADDICNYETFQTNLLRRKAERFGVEIPSEDEYWEEYPFVGVRYLSKNGRAKLSRRISDARLTHWKQWVDVFAPIVSVLISLLALAVAMVAIYLQLKGNVQQ